MDAENWLNTNKVSASEVIAYTYWFDEISMGLGLGKETLPLRVVSRADGYDLYEELYGDWPCRPRAIELMDGLFSVSEVGSAYLLRNTRNSAKNMKHFC